MCIAPDGLIPGDATQMGVDRSAGLNDVGMVAWLVTLRTPEYPEGRQTIVIANDITHQVWSARRSLSPIFSSACR